jgi:opacity protein-like surface antigen
MAIRLLKYFLAFCLLMGVGAVWVTSVRAEFVVDLYGGLAKTEDSDFQVRQSDVPQFGSGSVTSQTLKANGKFKDSFTVGGRVTYWTQRFPWLGVAFDGSYFKADAKNGNIEIPVYGFSLLMMMRYPLLVNEQFPQGRLQPYLGFGPEFAFGKVKAEFEENGFKTKIEENEGAFGVDVRTGLLWKLDQQWGIFTEYRFTYLNYNSEDSDNFVCIGDKKDCPESIKLEDFEAKLTTHHFLMGLSYRF